MKSDAKIAVELPEVRLVGRERELATLVRTAEAVVERGERHVVTICGAEGVGKTRLLEELCQELQQKGLFEDRVFRVQAWSCDGENALIARFLRAYFELDERAAHEEQVAALEQRVSQVLSEAKARDACHFLGHLAGIRTTGTPLTRALTTDPFRVGVVQQASLAGFLDADAAAAPLCLMFEDLQLADYQSLEMVLFLAESLSKSVLIVCSGRPEFFAQRERWSAFGAPRHELLELSWLDAADADRMIDDLLAPCEGGGPVALRRLVAEYGHGNPQLIRRAVECSFASGLLSRELETGSWCFDAARLGEFRMQSLRPHERLAGLTPSEERVLEHAAVVGDYFWLGALLALARAEATNSAENEPFQAIALSVHALEQRGLIYECERSILAEERQFAFRDEAERRELLARIDDRRKRQYHRTVGGFLADAFRDRNTTDISALAGEHFEASGSAERAATLYLSAAGLARSSYAPERAAELFGAALKLLTGDDDERRLRALHDQGDVLLSVGRTEEGINSFEIMLRLARQSNRLSKIGVAHNRIGRALRQIGRLGEAQKHFQRALEAFSAAGDERGIASTRDDIGRLAWMQGDVAHALSELHAAFEQRKQLAEPRSLALSLNNIGSVFLDRGQLGDAEQAFAAALYIRSRIDDRAGQIETLEAQGELALRLGEHVSAVELLERAEAIAKATGDRARLLPVLALLGRAHSCLGNADRAVSMLQVARVLAVDIGDELSHAEVQRLLACAYLATSDLPAAAEAANIALSIARKVRSKSLLTRALRTLGTVTASGAWGEANEGLAVDQFMSAVALAKETGNELELAKTYRAFASYARRFENAAIRAEAAKLRTMADEILTQYRPRASGKYSLLPEPASTSIVGLPALPERLERLAS